MKMDKNVIDGRALLNFSDAGEVALLATNLEVQRNDLKNAYHCSPGEFDSDFAALQSIARAVIADPEVTVRGWNFKLQKSKRNTWILFTENRNDNNN